ncbi:alpha/beta fold hydrolase [Microvirga sp. GCM10011540]|uniref:alpha/beta fold hydrolase n=1 Tax=Microvirga sp. GCM10011540 TaxID=3317338 RepID=UPI0036063621
MKSVRSRSSSVQLYETADNPIPAEPTLKSVTTEDGLTLRAAYWLPDGETPKGTVCILQGRAEFIEKYFEVVGELLGRGFAVVAFDWRGQGLSGRQVRNARKGHVRRFSDYRRDLDAIRDQILVPHLPEPHFGLAHSMGGAIALSAAHEGWLPFRRLVTTTPMIGLCIVKHSLAIVGTVRILKYLGFGKSFVPGGGETSISTLPFKGNRLTSDPVRYARNAQVAHTIGEGAVGAPTVSWLDSAFRFMKRFTDPRYALRIRLPTLVLAAGADPVCATPVTERFAARLKAGHAIVIPGARHEILMETDAIREQFWAAFDAFVPGSPDRSPREEPEAAKPESAAEQLDGGGVDTAVARSDDAPALSG